MGKINNNIFSPIYFYFGRWIGNKTGFLSGYFIKILLFFVILIGGRNHEMAGYSSFALAAIGADKAAIHRAFSGVKVDN